MDIVTQVMEKVNAVFSEKHLEERARETGFIIRKRKISAKKFLENIMLLKLEFPNSSLEDLVIEFFKNDIVISKQALHKKIGKQAVEFMNGVLEELLRHTFHEKELFLGAIPSINNVQIIDSSEIRLNKKLEDLYPQVRNQGAAVKVQALMDVVNNEIKGLDIRPSKEPDQSYKEHLFHINAGDLSIADLGYFSVESFAHINSKGGFFLSRYFKKAHVFDLNTGEKIDLRAILRETREEKLERQIAL